MSGAQLYSRIFKNVGLPPEVLIGGCGECVSHPAPGQQVLRTEIRDVFTSFGNYLLKHSSRCSFNLLHFLRALHLEIGSKVKQRR